MAPRKKKVESGSSARGGAAAGAQAAAAGAASQHQALLRNTTAAATTSNGGTGASAQEVDDKAKKMAPRLEACVEWQLAAEVAGGSAGASSAPNALASSVGGGAPTASTSPSYQQLQEQCGPAARHHTGRPHALPALPLNAEDAAAAASPELRQFWSTLDAAQRAALLRVPRRELFERVRAAYCSRCFGLFTFRYEELRTEAHDCAACRACYGGLRIAGDGAVTLDDALLFGGDGGGDGGSGAVSAGGGGPFAAFAAGAARGREREAAFAAADAEGGGVCGGGWLKRPGAAACALHTAPVPLERAEPFVRGLPRDNLDALLSWGDEDFLAAPADHNTKFFMLQC